jgi:hypothetical protein
MRRAVERLLVAPLSRLVASNQVQAGDVITVRLRNDVPVFIREPAGGKPTKGGKNRGDKIVK